MMRRQDPRERSRTLDLPSRLFDTFRDIARSSGIQGYTYDPRSLVAPREKLKPEILPLWRLSGEGFERLKISALERLTHLEPVTLILEPIANSKAPIQLPLRWDNKPKSFIADPSKEIGIEGHQFSVVPSVSVNRFLLRRMSDQKVVFEVHIGSFGIAVIPLQRWEGTAMVSWRISAGIDRPLAGTAETPFGGKPAEVIKPKPRRFKPNVPEGMNLPRPLRAPFENGFATEDEARFWQEWLLWAYVHHQLNDPSAEFWFSAVETHKMEKVRTILSVLVGDAVKNISTERIIVISQFLFLNADSVGDFRLDLALEALELGDLQSYRRFQKLALPGIDDPQARKLVKEHLRTRQHLRMSIDDAYFDRLLKELKTVRSLEELGPFLEATKALDHLQSRSPNLCALIFIP
jgi:hypothetical protein